VNIISATKIAAMPPQNTIRRETPRRRVSTSEDSCRGGSYEFESMAIRVSSTGTAVTARAKGK